MTLSLHYFHNGPIRWAPGIILRCLALYRVFIACCNRSRPWFTSSLASTITGSMFLTRLGRNRYVFAKPLWGLFIGFWIDFDCFSRCSRWSSHRVPMCSFSKTCMPTTVRDVHIDIDPYYFKPSQPFIFSVLLQGTWVLLSRSLLMIFRWWSRPVKFLLCILLALRFSHVTRIYKLH